MSRIDSSPASEPSSEQYFRNAPILYSLWAGADVLGILLGLHYASGLEDLDKSGLIVFSVLRAVGSILTLSLGFVRVITFQWIVLGLLFFELAALVVSFMTDLAGA